jgi:hypothetical protein
MPETHIAHASVHPARMKLEPYNAEIRLTNLTLGIDNIHYDVFLSPRFVEFTRKYLGDLVRQAVNINLPFGKDKDRKQSGSPEHGAFRKMLTDILQESVTRAKFQQSVETDVLHHLALLKFISQETGNQFSSILVEGKDWIRGRGELFEHSEQAHVMRSKIADLQADRKNVIRQVGETLCRIWREVEEGTISKTRRALFGDDFPEAYPLLQNRFLFVEGGNDDQFFLEHYVLLGNFVNDPDRFETFDALLLDFVRDYVLAGDSAEELSKARNVHERLLEQARLLRSEHARVEAEQEEIASRAGDGDRSFPSLFKRKTATAAGAQGELDDLRRKSASLEKNLEDLDPQIVAAKQRLEFLTEELQNRLGDYLNQPANAHRLFDAHAAPGEVSPADGESAAETRAKLLEEWVHRLEERDLLFHVLASYEMRKISADYCPPVHLQQLKKALVQREETKRVAQILEKFPARKVSMKKLEEASRAIRRRTTEETLSVGLQFAEDLMRLRRDRRNYQQVAAWMERINLVHSERARELSRSNKSLYEFLHPDENRPRLDQHDQGFAFARHESRFAFQHELARAREADARALRRRQGLHRGRRHHSGHLRNRINPRDAAGSRTGLRPRARDSGRHGRVQQPRQDYRPPAAGVGRGSRVPGFRSLALGRRRFQDHDFPRAQSFRPPLELRENGEALVSNERLAVQHFSAPDAHGRRRGR